jgi:hypothetical protein
MIRGEGWQYRLGSSIHEVTEMENAGVRNLLSDFTFYSSLDYIQKIAAGISAAVGITVLSLLLRKRILLRRRPKN